MSIRSRTEECFKKEIAEKLTIRGGSHRRVWLDSSKYENKIIFDAAQIEPLKVAKIVYPIHSYEIFDMEDEQVINLQYLMCQKIENHFINMLSEFPNHSKIIYVEGDLEISLDYRVCRIKVDYNIVNF